MLNFPCSVEVYVCLKPMDMRCGFDRLAAATREHIKANPLSGHLFVFFNKVRNRVKILLWNRSGYCVYYKRLESGRFHHGSQANAGLASYRVNSAELQLILEGLDLTTVRRKKRFYYKKSTK